MYRTILKKYGFIHEPNQATRITVPSPCTSSSKALKKPNPAATTEPRLAAWPPPRLLVPPLPFPPPLHGRAVSLGCLLPYRRRHVRGGGEPGARRPPRPLCQGHPEGAA
jgi:hypothetical protein